MFSERDEKETLASTLSLRRSFSYRNQSINFLCKSLDWFLYDRNIRHELTSLWIRAVKLYCTQCLFREMLLTSCSSINLPASVVLQYIALWPAMITQGVFWRSTFLRSYSNHVYIGEPGEKLCSVLIMM